MDNLYLNYGLVCLSVIIFGFNFACTDKVRQYCGSGLGVTFFTTVIGSGFSAIVLFIMNGFRFEFSGVSLLIAMIAALSSILFTFCSYRALDKINLSLYSLFSMLGGMVLPFAVGIIFFKEDLTAAKGICFIIICIALVLSTQRGDDKRGYIYYAGVFVLNGMSGVLTTVYKRLDGQNVSSMGYSLLCSLCAVSLAAVLLPMFKKDLSGINKPLRAAGIIILSGFSNRMANLILTVALAVLPASAQYPMVTGGVIIVSTVIAAFSNKKPSKREILSVILSFTAILALVAIPF